MKDIKKLPSGYYAIYDDEKIDPTNVSLIKWNGQRGVLHPFNTDNGPWDYFIAPDNTVFYTEQGGINARIWCPGSRLAAHCCKLAQIAARN